MSSFTLPSPTDRVVAVLGGGVLGRRIACTWAASGHNVIIRDPSPDQRIAAVHYCEASMSQYTPSSSSSIRGTVQAVDSLPQAVSKAWLVIEAVPEKLPLKQSTFSDLQALAPADALLCTNSSSYKSREVVGHLEPATRRRALNMHYYMPPGNRVVELMPCGDTHASVFPFLAAKLAEAGMKPFVARRESTGLIFNRLWAAVKREVLTILAEDVSTPEEIDQLWVEMWSGKRVGPAAMMDAVGLDTVSLIEQHYVAERGLPSTPVDFLRTYIAEGRLGEKSPAGGLLPPSHRRDQPGTEHGGAGDTPLLYFLDLGLSASNPADAFSSGRVLLGAQDERPLRSLASGQRAPDGIDVSLPDGKLFWTSMGVPSLNDGAVYSCALDGSGTTEVVAPGRVHTPKQLAVDAAHRKLYFADREGMRIMRCALDGSSLETVVRAGDPQDQAHRDDPTRWCVGVAVSPSTGKFYWTQKGPSKGSRGRIFRANIDFLPGEDASGRTDVELLFAGLPEPIDLEIDEVRNVLYWTDRGELPFGNSINRAALDDIKTENLRDGEEDKGKAAARPGRDYELVRRGFHEAIGIKLDQRNRHIYATDLGGSVYRLDLDGGNMKEFYRGEGAFAGITLAHV